MGLQRTANTLAHKKSLRLETTQTGKLKLEPDAELPHEKFGKLCESNPKFKATYERKRRVKDWTTRAYEESLAQVAVADDWTDQQIADLLIAFRRKHSERLEMDQRHYALIITRARKQHMRHSAMEVLKNDSVSGVKDNLEILSTLIGVKIEMIQRYCADPPIYLMRLGNGRTVQLGECPSLIEQKSLRKVLIDYAN